MEDDSTITPLKQPGSIIDPLTEIARDGARRMLGMALKNEVDAFLAQYSEERLADGRARVVRHGAGPERVIQTGIGPLPVARPKVRDRAPDDAGAERIRFSSAILPKWARRTRSLDALLPVLYLRGVSMGDFQEALTALLGREAPNLSPGVIARLTAGWQEDHDRWQRRDLSARHYVYIWADGVYLQARAVLFRCRDRLVHQRTELVNALRATLYEFGLIVPKGIAHLKRMEEFVEAESVSLPTIVRKECRDLLEQIDEQSTRIMEKTRAMVGLSEESGVAQRLETMPGVGPLTALAVEAFAPSMETFRSGRDFAAWLGLVPRQFSSGGKERLGRISKAGQADIRRLLIIGAMTRVNWASRKPPLPGTWLARMLSRKPRTLVAIALANKMARTIWAMLTKQENYRDPVLSATA